MNILEHKTFLLFATVLIGGGESIIIYRLYMHLFNGPVPFVLIVLDVLISFAVGLGLAEVIWRINRYLDSQGK